MKKFLSRIRRNRSGFTLIELLVVITIIGVLVTIVVVAVAPVQKKSRDSKRKSDINLLLTGLNLFKADFKVYPNYTMYLGTNTAVGAKNSNFDLGGDLPACESYQTGGVPQAGHPSKFVLPTYTPGSYDSAKMLPGFASVNNFLMCLKYVDRLVVDPKPNTDADPQDDYHYRVSYDYADVLVSAKLEVATDQDAKHLFITTIPKRYYLGTGVLTRHLEEDSNTNGFFNILNGNITDGSYLYQCQHVVPDERVNFDPIQANGTGGWQRNTSCNNVSLDLYVAASK